MDILNIRKKQTKYRDEFILCWHEISIHVLYFKFFDRGRFRMKIHLKEIIINLTSGRRECASRRWKIRCEHMCLLLSMCRYMYRTNATRKIRRWKVKSHIEPRFKQQLIHQLELDLDYVSLQKQRVNSEWDNGFFSAKNITSTDLCRLEQNKNIIQKRKHWIQ